jgi:hypothetical protein
MDDLLNDFETTTKQNSKFARLIDFAFLSTYIAFLVMALIEIIGYILNDEGVGGELLFVIIVIVFFLMTAHFVFRRSRLGWVLVAITMALIGSSIGKGLYFQATLRWRSTSLVLSGLMVYSTISSTTSLILLCFKNARQLFKISRNLMSLRILLCALIIFAVLYKLE